MFCWARWPRATVNASRLPCTSETMPYRMKAPCWRRRRRDDVTWLWAIKNTSFVPPWGLGQRPLNRYKGPTKAEASPPGRLTFVAYRRQKTLRQVNLGMGTKLYVGNLNYR